MFKIAKLVNIYTLETIIELFVWVIYYQTEGLGSEVSFSLVCVNSIKKLNIIYFSCKEICMLEFHKNTIFLTFENKGV